jgi:AAA domain
MAEAKTGARTGVRRTAKQENENPVALIEDEVTIEVTDLGAHIPSKNIVIYGPFGGGKTVLAGGVSLYERCGQAVFLSTEPEGAVSSRQAGGRAKLWNAPTWEHAVAGVKKAEDELDTDDWLIVDSGTEMHTLYARWILLRQNARNPKRDLDILAIKDHQKWQNGFKRWYSRIVRMRCNTIFICTAMTEEDAEGETRVIPQIQGKRGEISDYISQLASVVLYYGVARESREAGLKGPILRRALAQPYPPWEAKDRFSALGRYWDVEEGDYTAMADMARAIDISLKETATDGKTAKAGTRPSRPGRTGQRVAAKARSETASTRAVRNERRARGRA